MSVFSLSLVSAEAIQGTIQDHFPIFAGEGQFTFLPKTNFLTSAVNTNGVLDTVVSPGGAKKRIAKTVYQPRVREADVSTSVSFNCTSSNEAGQLSTTCEIDETAGVFIDEKIDRVALADIDMPNELYIARRIMALQDALHRKLETGLGTKLAAAFGKYPDNDTSITGGTLKTVSTLQTSSDNTSLDAIEELEYTRRLTGLPRMYTFGDNLLTKYVTRLDSGCCADGYGVDLATFAGRNGFVHFHDNRVSNDLDAGNFFILFPGAAHIVSFNRFDGPNRIEDNSYKQMVVPSPLFPGLAFDVTMKEDCGDLYIEMGLAYELCTAPTDYFAIDDRLDGFNGILEGKVSNS